MNNLKKTYNRNVFRNAIKSATMVLKKEKPLNVKKAIKTARKVIAE